MKSDRRSISLPYAMFIAAFFIASNSAFAAELRLAKIFSDHVVLQREKPVAVWGWAEANAAVAVNFDEQTVETICDKDGRWQLKLAPMPAQKTGKELTVTSGESSIALQDVVVGDVWHASGQSNMAMTVDAVARRLPQAKLDIEAASFSSIRFRRINDNESPKPLDDISNGNWTVCSTNTAGSFSAAAFYFARELYQELDVPIGIIDSSRGGTPIEPFILREAFESHPTLQRELELGDKEDLKAIWMMPGGVRARSTLWLPGRLFNSRLAPITRFAVRGTIWYQAESNCGDGEDPRDYWHKMRALINGWRAAFDDKEMPFYFVQLPGSGARGDWVYMREQQRLSCGLPKTGMVVTIDLLDKDIHPPNKIDVGKRLARWALGDEYGKQIACSGPLFQRADIESDRITVHFEYADDGLMIAVKDGLSNPKETDAIELSHFELIDESGKWLPAKASINGRTVVVTSEHVSKPIAVRYGYELDPQHCHLYNRSGLPASPFCSKPEMLEPVIDLENWSKEGE